MFESVSSISDSSKELILNLIKTKCMSVDLLETASAVKNNIFTPKEDKSFAYYKGSRKC